MFSYRHSFHAGNHADIFKHLCLTMLLEKLREKEKPFIYIDTHSGAGRYDLTDDSAQKTGEYQHGVVNFLDHTVKHPDLAEYQRRLKEYFADNLYPGSPQIAKDALRPQDTMVCMEFHNAEIGNLKRNLRGEQVTLHHRDGFEGLVAISPPKPSRGLVLVDPPYERIEEYEQVAQALSKAQKRWQTGIFAVWLPLLSERAGAKVQASENMLTCLAELPAKNVLYAEFCPQANTPDAGMYGSAMVIVNCPWQIDTRIKAAGAELLTFMGRSNQATASVMWLKEGD